MRSRLPKTRKESRIVTNIFISVLLLGVFLAVLEIAFIMLVPVISHLGIPLAYKRPFVILFFTMGIGLVVCFVGGGVASTWWKKKGGQNVGLRLLPIFPLVMILSAFAALPWMFQDKSIHIDLSEAGFAQSTLTFTDAQDIHLHNRSSRHTQIVCLGEHQDCQSDDFGPKELQPPGLSLPPGQTITFTFPHSGTYHLTILTARMHTELTGIVTLDCLYRDICGGDD